MEKIAKFFSTFGDETRLKILVELLKGEQTVGMLANNCELTISNTSHQLRILKEQRLVKSTRNGKYVIYSLDDDHVETIIQYGIEHIEEGK